MLVCSIEWVHILTSIDLQSFWCFAYLLKKNRRSVSDIFKKTFFHHAEKRSIFLSRSFIILKADKLEISNDEDLILLRTRRKRWDSEFSTKSKWLKCVIILMNFAPSNSLQKSFLSECLIIRPCFTNFSNNFNYSSVFRRISLLCDISFPQRFHCECSDDLGDAEKGYELQSILNADSFTRQERQ